jgi:integrase
MASIIKRPDSSCWIACFTDLNGRRLKRSTKIPAKERNRREAERIAVAFDEAARKKRTAAQTRRVIASLHASITGEGLPVQTLRGFVERWLETKEPETAPATITFYRNMWTKVARFFGPRADEDMAEIERQDIVDFRNHEAKTLAPKSVNHGLKWMRMVFRAARLDGVIADDPTEKVGPVSMRGVEVRSRRPLTLPEIRAVLAVADDEWRSLIKFGLFTGQRLADLAVLTWANLDLQGAELRLVQRKTGKRVMLPLAGPLLAHVESLPVSDDPSMPIHPRAYAMIERTGRAAGLSAQFADLLAQAGLRKKQRHTRTHGKGSGIGNSAAGISFHSLRHSAVSFLKEAGVPESVVMEWVGHDSVEISRHYTRSGKDAMVRAAESFPDLVKGPEE